MQWHDCYYHFWSAVLLNEGCCRASCMGMIILQGICGLVPPGWVWWMGRKWWCLKHSQVLPDPSHSIITVTLSPKKSCMRLVEDLFPGHTQVADQYAYWMCWVPSFHNVANFFFVWICIIKCCMWGMVWLIISYLVSLHSPISLLLDFFLDGAHNGIALRH